uniref:N-acetyltransferase domain-containing protein n=1 Tax=viral metagenome TaxID=1070528 RepID=A0A6C0I7G8_9ZZZZ
MWKTFPIQTTQTTNPECQSIDSAFTYKKWDEVTTCFWKDTPIKIKQWCLSLWRFHFKIMRDGMDDGDLIGYIPGQGTIIAKHGKWIGSVRSRTVGYINYLFVDASKRGGGLAQKLIETILNRARQEWINITAFLFEVRQTPPSLAQKTSHYMCRFSYVWIPFFADSDIPEWKPFLEFKEYLQSKKGFVGSYTDWRAYRKDENIIVFDSHDDIVWYSSFISLPSFDGFQTDGAYCRVFSPFGNVTVYAENIYFTPSSTTHYLLG